MTISLSKRRRTASRPGSGPDRVNVNGAASGIARGWSGRLNGNRHGANDVDRLLLIIALVICMLWAVQATDFERVKWWTAAALAGGAFLIWRVIRRDWWAAWATVWFCCAVGFFERVVRVPFRGSDTLDTTAEAIQVVRNFGNPYDHYYTLSRPAGSTFPYLPGELAFYAIPKWLFNTLTGTDKWMGIAICFILASLAWRVGPGRAAVGTALYGTFAFAAYRSTDNSNDTGFAFLLVLAFALLAFSERGGRHATLLFYLSAGTFAWALAFKQFAWLFLPPLILYLRQRGASWRVYGTIGVVVTALAVLPFFVTAPAGFLKNAVFVGGQHEAAWGLNIWGALKPHWPGPVRSFLGAMPVISLGVTAFALFRLFKHPASNLGIAILQGLGLFFLLIFFARWTTYTYYSGASAVLCLAVTLLPLPGDEPEPVSPPDTWTRQRLPGASTVRRVVHADGIFAALGEDGRLLLSDDGRDWRETILPDGTVARDVVSGDGVLIAVGDDGSLFTLSGDTKAGDGRAQPTGRLEAMLDRGWRWLVKR